ncbi:MAG: ATP synthase subunit a [Candidatus Hydrogenedentes bacterium ADurb.Bin101]|nr:MAG: ATP synthase subunit a [Candidatus Hydrogenedentes bacterium ADurb.Bin101]
MEEIGHRLVWHYMPFTDIELPFGGVNVLTVANTILAMLLLWGGLRWATRHLEKIPGRVQMFSEIMLNVFRGLLEPSLGTQNRKLFQQILLFVLSLFLFIAASNAIVLIPAPYVEEPTGDLNCTLALAVIVFFYSFYLGLRVRGVRGVLTEFCGPMWHQPGIPAKMSALFFFPMRLVEEVSRVISLSCRLFGNVIGTGVVILIFSSLTYHLVIPIGLYGLLVVFEAGLQAFVFASLTIVYISTAVNSE